MVEQGHLIQLAVLLLLMRAAGAVRGQLRVELAGQAEGERVELLLCQRVLPELLTPEAVVEGLMRPEHTMAAQQVQA
jgi:hypothetical protein